MNELGGECNVSCHPATAGKKIRWCDLEKDVLYKVENENVLSLAIESAMKSILQQND